MPVYMAILLAIMLRLFFFIYKKEKRESDMEILKIILISSITLLSIAMCTHFFFKDSTLLKIAKASSGELEGRAKSDAYSHLMQKSIENLTTADASDKLKFLTKNFVENCLECLNEEKNQKILANVSDTFATSFKKNVLPWKT